MRVLELFAGYGSQALALENLGIEFTSDISEIDKYAIQAYNQLHGETHNWGDITKIDETKLPYYDLITYSFPCQDISLAGLQRGLDNGAGTRSSLLWECERIIRAVKPKYLLMENVKNLVGEKHKHNFIRWLRVLEMMGYQNFWKVLNAKDYGVPQNRERVFVVSILGCGQYLFPNPIKLEKRLKDVLEDNVDEKYYLSDKLIEGFMKRVNKNESGFAREINIRDKENIASTLTARMHKCGVTDNYIQEPLALDEQNGYIRQDGTVGTLTTDGSTPKHNNRVVEPLLIKDNTSKGYAEAVVGDSITLDQPKSETRRGRVGHQVSQTLTTSCNVGVVQVGNIVNTGNWDNPNRGRIYSDKGISPCLSTMQGGGLEPKIYTEGNYMNSNHSASRIVNPSGISPTVMENHGTVTAVTNHYRIRKLTPRECWRLMGVKDEQFDKLHDLSNTQLYKMAGNSIVVDVLMGIFKNLFLSDDGTTGQLTLF